MAARQAPHECAEVRSPVVAGFRNRHVADLSPRRPGDVRLRIGRAEALLPTRLRGARKFLAAQTGTGIGEAGR